MSQIGSDDKGRLDALEARVEAMSALVKTVLTTLVLRGTLTKASVDQILAESKVALGEGGVRELASVQQELPAYLRQAMGPEPDEDDHDH